MARHARRARDGRGRRLQLPEAANRRGSGHHQRPGPGEYLGGRFLATRGRAARHIPHRERDGGTARTAGDPLPLALRPVPGHRHLQGRHRHLFRAPAGQPAHPGGARQPARRRHSDHGADLDWPRGNLSVDGGVRARRQEGRRHPLYTDRSARNPGLDHQAAAAPGTRRHGNQLDRRLRQGIPDRSRSGQAQFLRDVPGRRGRRARTQQRQRRRRLHRTPW